MDQRAHKYSAAARIIAHVCRCVLASKLAWRPLRITRTVSDARTRRGTRSKWHCSLTGWTKADLSKLPVRYTLTLRVVHQRELEAKVKFLQSVILRARVCARVRADGWATPITQPHRPMPSR